MEKKDEPASFEIDGIKFSHWEFNYAEGCKTDAWIAISTIKAVKFDEAFNEFSKKLSKLIPRISLISQCYNEYISEPFLIHKTDSDTVFFRSIRDIGAVGLMFNEEGREALEILQKNTEIPDEFYYYWKDAVNTTGYSAKLLLIFSAIEALAKKNGKKDWSLIKGILGEDLTSELFEQSNKGLRHRLVHGEYFHNQDLGKNYLELIHNKVITYFNKEIFSKPLICEYVRNPQRHFWGIGNKQECLLFLRRKDGNNSFSLKDLLNEFNLQFPSAC